MSVKRIINIKNNIYINSIKDELNIQCNILRLYSYTKWEENISFCHPYDGVFTLF